jgi:nucleoid DNA-binding protein
VVINENGLQCPKHPARQHLQKMALAASKSVKFKPGKLLKDALN